MDSRFVSVQLLRLPSRLTRPRRSCLTAQGPSWCVGRHRAQCSRPKVAWATGGAGAPPQGLDVGWAQHRRGRAQHTGACTSAAPGDVQQLLRLILQEQCKQLRAAVAPSAFNHAVQTRALRYQLTVDHHAAAPTAAHTHLPVEPCQMLWTDHCRALRS